MIQVNNLHKSFGKIHALKGVSFSAPDGKITGLLGPNGAGKTTCLRILYTVLNPDLGEALVDGLSAVKAPLDVQRRIGVLPDASGIYPRLTTRENIRYYGRLHGLNGAALEGRIDELIKLFDMSDIADRRTEGFSTGQRVKVAIGRALVHSPKNVLLDEPTSGLDVMSTRAMRDVIRRMRDDGKCVLFSSHIMQEVSALCDNIVIIAKGEIAAEGSPDALRQKTGYENLEDAFVEVIGSGEGLE
ncbi:MAG: ATP-binding cassette domain-containing protein [Anaerolineae bacterium]|nr:ATP-binding cassette domain-containing protein [Anaerolineae bacterium]